MNESAISNTFPTYPIDLSISNGIPSIELVGAALIFITFGRHLVRFSAALPATVTQVFRVAASDKRNSLFAHYFWLTIQIVSICS